MPVTTIMRNQNLTTAVPGRFLRNVDEKHTKAGNKLTLTIAIMAMPNASRSRIGGFRPCVAKMIMIWIADIALKVMAEARAPTTSHSKCRAQMAKTRDA
jgi:hypothetical protein